MKDEIAVTAERKTSLKTWLGLGLMSAQFGVLARLTWWEYSWDIMEPVTYFVTYGTVMGAFAYYCLTNQVNIICFFVSFSLEFPIAVSGSFFLFRLNKFGKIV